MCLLKPCVSLIQVSFNAIAFFSNRMQACLKQAACFIKEVATMTGFTELIRSASPRKVLLMSSLSLCFH